MRPKEKRRILEEIVNFIGLREHKFTRNNIAFV